MEKIAVKMNYKKLKNKLEKMLQSNVKNTTTQKNSIPNYIYIEKNNIYNYE